MQERAESAAKAEVDAKAIAVLKGTVHDLTLEVAGLEERAWGLWKLRLAAEKFGKALA